MHGPANLIESLQTQTSDLRTAARKYIEAHKLMRVRFQDAIDATTYSDAAKKLEELVDG